MTISNQLFAQRHHNRRNDSKKDSSFVQISDTLNRAPGDSLALSNDSTIVTVDSLAIPKKKSIVDIPIEYQCDDSLMISLSDKKVYMYGSTSVKSGSMNLDADYMQIDMDTRIVYAEGTEDSVTHEIIGKPEFKDNNDEFTAKTIKYNFVTKEGYVCEVNTEQENGFLFGERTKIHANREIHLKNGRYTTCDEENPHFYFEMTKAKFIPNDKIIAGPSYLVLLDVPVYCLGIPFGIFPSSKRRHSGIVVPKYGEESKRGLYLQDGGYYLALGDYVDLQLLGSLYTYGGWGAKVISQFKVRYKFSGNFNFSYMKNISGLREFENIKGASSDVVYSSMSSYTFRLSVNQDSKANPNSSFGVNVSYDKSRYDLQNSNNYADVTRSTTQSSINYNTSMFNGKANLSATSNMVQNFADSSITLTLPTFAFSVSKFFPFKRKVQVGKQRWYEKINSSFNANFSNKIDRVHDSLFMKKEMWDYAKYGFEYSVPISTSFSVLKYVTVSPSFKYHGRIYPNYIIKYMNPQAQFGTSKDTTIVHTGIDTINCLRHNYDFDFSIGASTKIYGIFTFNRLKHLKAFRHVITPSIGFSMRPDFSSENFDYYRQDPTDPEGLKYYSIYQNGIYGYPPSGKMGAITFSLANNFEMKVKTKKDTTEGSLTKIKLLENLSFSGSYNLAADSCKLSNISVNTGTRLFDKINVTVFGTLNPYKLDSLGRKTKYYEFKESNGRKWARLESATISTSYSISSNSFGKNKDKKNADVDEDQAEVDEFGNVIFTTEEIEEKRKLKQRKENDDEYNYYNVPWSLSGSYSFSYSKPGKDAPIINQSINFSGNFTFTDKWTMSYNSGYNIQKRQFNTTSLSVTRNLHCFSLSFSIIPFGTLKSYNFRLAFGSALFQGIDYKRRQTWRDN
ncbi:MAG: hypothetical protein MJ211_11550 [Bacteroidales bacterium]|nr:hypothetical protein [Bacteroidales bacterium]